MTTGERIRQIRLEKKIKQQDLAKELGVTPSMIAQYESGVREPKRKTLIKIADALGVSTVELIDPSEYAVSDVAVINYLNEIKKKVADNFKDASNNIKMMDDSLKDGNPEVVISFPKLCDFLEDYGVYFDSNSKEFIFIDGYKHYPVNNQQIAQIISITSEQIKTLIKTLSVNNEKSEKPDQGNEV